MSEHSKVRCRMQSIELLKEARSQTDPTVRATYLMAGGLFEIAAAIWKLVYEAEASRSQVDRP